MATKFTAKEVKPILLQLARRIERLHIGKLKRGKQDPVADKSVLKLMLIHDSIDWWSSEKIKKVYLWLKINHGI